MLKFLSISAVSIAATVAHAGAIGPPPTVPPVSTVVIDPDPSLFLGLTWTFGARKNTDGKPGITLKILSTNEKDKAAAIAGVTWNFDGSWGCDVGVAYNDDSLTVGFSYDICQRNPQFAIGGTDDPDETVVTQQTGGPTTPLN